MDLKEFIENFASQFDDTDESEFAAETKFHELEEWSSVMGLAIIAMLGDTYEITIKGAELRATETVEDVYELVMSKL